VQDDDQTKKQRKKRYERPRVLDSATFETLALSCNKTTDDSDCLVPPNQVSDS
jgi:hypothetical protein